MKKLIFLSFGAASMMLAACQFNSVKDTGGGSVSPTSTVTGIKLGVGSPP